MCQNPLNPRKNRIFTARNTGKSKIKMYIQCTSRHSMNFSRGAWYMAAIGKADQRLLAQLSQLALCNPFTPERLKLEKAVLGNRFQPEEMIAWSRSHSLTESERPNVTELASISRAVIRRVQLAVAAGESINEQTVRHYWNVATYVLLYRHVVPIAPEKIAQPKSIAKVWHCLLYTSPSPRDQRGSRMPSSA